MTAVHWAYPDDLMAGLARLGVEPKPHTPPSVVREFVNDLYRYEIRRLRDCLLRGDFPKNAYIDRVVTLRNKYSILALKPFQFVE